MASATDAAIQKKMFGSGAALVFLNEETDDIMKILKSLKEARFLIKDVGEIVKN